jgi:uncharacterized phage protein gp47/JayE
VSIELSTYQDIVNRIRADVTRLLPDLDPTIFGSLIRAITDSNAGRHYDNVLSIGQLQTELFPQTAEGSESLDRWAEYEGLTRFAATQSNGSVIIVGTEDTVIEQGREFKTEDGKIYTTDDEAIITDTIISVSSITRSGSTATVTTTSDHNFATNIEVIISGADQSEYNGTVQITVLNVNQFSYEVTGAPATPATGTIEANCVCANVTITSQDFGSDQNLLSGAKLTLTSPIIGADSDAYVTFLGVLGGTDEETNALLFVRVLQSRSNPVANFNVAAIEKATRSVQGVTRVKIKRITPDVGSVTILFVRDNDDNIIPDSSEILEVKNTILEILQATSEESDVIVLAPTPISTDYTFSAISPDTDTMKTAIEANLAAFYRNNVDFETLIQEDSYRNAIIDTVDPDTGDILQSFTLSSPTGDISVGVNSKRRLWKIVFGTCDGVLSFSSLRAKAL